MREELLIRADGYEIISTFPIFFFLSQLFLFDWTHCTLLLDNCNAKVL